MSRVVTSPVFTFRVGTESTPITLHNALVAQQSSTLNSLMNGAMSEAKAGYADMPDVDVRTFVHFSQWLYTGRYDLPYCKTPFQLPSFAGLDDEIATENIAWDHGNNEKKINGKASELTRPHGKQQIWTHFTRHLASTPAPPPRENPTEIDGADSTEILLDHAQLYCFADKYGILQLQKLCFNALHTALIDLECRQDQVDGIVQLIAYTMENTPSTRVHSLRTLVLEFAVIVFEVLIQSDTFMQLLRMNHDLSIKLLVWVSRRLD